MKRGMSPAPNLYNAAFNGDTERIKRLLDAGADPNGGSAIGRVPLCAALRTGNNDAVRLLLDAGAAVNARESDGRCALSIAVACGKWEAAEMLMAAGAEYKTDSAAREIIYMSAYTDNKKIFDFIEKEYAGRFDFSSSLFTAAMYNNYSFIERFACYSSDIDMESETGGSVRTALHCAVSRGHAETVQMLLELGADVNRKGCGHDLPIVLAVFSGSCKTLEIVTDHGADINAYSRSGFTALEAAIYRESSYMVKFLIERGADPNLASFDGTPLTDAIIRTGSFKSNEICRLLLNAGADVNASADQGGEKNTPLHVAARKGKISIMELLIKKGGSLYVKNSLNRYPLDILKEIYPDKYENHAENLRLLAEKESGRRLKLEDSRAAVRTGFEFDI